MEDVYVVMQRQVPTNETAQSCNLSLIMAVCNQGNFVFRLSDARDPFHD